MYSPTDRATALEAMRHSFFDELRDPACWLPNGERPTAWQAQLQWPSCRPRSACQAGAYPLPALARALLSHPWMLLSGSDFANSRRPLDPHRTSRTRALAAGRPLPPLFNWIDGELQEVPAEHREMLQPRPAAAAASS